MPDSAAKFVLGSRSPRRHELLRLLVPEQAIKVLPPRSAGELGFEGLHDWPAIEARIRQIVRHKNEDVLSQLPAENEATIITADTVIVAIDEAQKNIVLGQPPPGENWRDVVREWFSRYYLGKTHIAATAFSIEKAKGERIEQVVTTRVTFHANDPETRSLVEWYLDTGESLGKAGGYAIQGAGSLFVAGIEGSLSNVVGLPLRELSLAISCQ